MKVGVVDFFSGCGGASTGFAAASVPGATIEIVSGVDFDQAACATFTRAHDKPAHCEDIRELLSNPRKMQGLIDEWALERYDKVIFIGCAPCQGFAAHTRTSDRKDPRRHLFVMFAELAARLQPDGIFMENVPDIFSKKHWPFFSAGRDALSGAGYTLRSQIYNFAGFGLPQERFRAVMLALRSPFEMPAPPIEPSDFRTVRESIGQLPSLRPGEVAPFDAMHRTSNHRPATVDIIRQVPPNGGSRPIGVGPKCLDRAREKHGGYTDVYGRLAWDKPSVTITSRCRTPSCGRFAHPEQHRGLSVREAALLQGFPKDFVFEGNFDEKFKQIGNAVPPLVARFFAEHLVRCMLGLHPALAANSAPDVTEPVGPGFAVTINGIKKRRAAKESQKVDAVA